MPTPRAVLDLAKASHRTLGWRGLERRALYELSRRSGLLARAEQRWLAKLDRAEVGLGPIDLSLLRTSGPTDFIASRPSSSSTAPSSSTRSRRSAGTRTR
jgi:hypothetical protein